jgi:phosphohistidine phosphatase
VYDAALDDLMDIVRETPADAAILALVGHNPGAAQLVRILTGESELRFPTSALAMIDIGQDWDRTVPGSGSLSGYWTPKGGSAILRD